MRHRLPCSSIALPANFSICSIVRSMTSRPVRSSLATISCRLARRRSCQCHQREIRTDAHQHIGMVDGVAVASCASKTIGSKLKWVQKRSSAIGWCGPTGPHRPRDRYGRAPWRRCPQDRRRPFRGPSSRSRPGRDTRLLSISMMSARRSLRRLSELHRIDGHMSAGMGGEPVVREHRIRRVTCLVLEQVHGDAWLRSVSAAR